MPEVERSALLSLLVPARLFSMFSIDPRTFRNPSGAECVKFTCPDEMPFFQIDVRRDPADRDAAYFLDVSTSAFGQMEISFIIVTSGGKNIAPQNLENLLKNDRYVSQAFVYGDRKKYLTALVTLAPEEIVAWAARQGIQDRRVEALARHHEVLQLMRGRVDEVNRGLASFEQVKKFALLETDFSQETGELTPTLKVRRKVVVEKYGRILDDLYGKD